MAIKHCAACAQTFQPYPQTPNQTYCSAPECQKCAAVAGKRMAAKLCGLSGQPSQSPTCMAGPKPRLLAWLQRWTRQTLAFTWRPAYITSDWRLAAKLQRWTSGRWKSRCSTAPAVLPVKLQREDYWSICCAASIVSSLSSHVRNRPWENWHWVRMSFQPRAKAALTSASGADLTPLYRRAHPVPPD